MQPVVFIHTNNQQLLAAKLSAYSLQSRSEHPGAFEIRILQLEDTPHLYGREGQRYLSNGKLLTWHNRDLDSFHPLRRMVPQVMEFQGRALVLDPDIFAVGDVYELLARDMEGKAIVCRTFKEWLQGRIRRRYASGVMLLDCARLTHWKWDEQIDAVFERKLDLAASNRLATEPPGNIGLLEEEWNHFDTFTEHTKLLHNTEMLTQPWKTGLPIDYGLNARVPHPLRDRILPERLLELARRTRRRLRGQVYQPHPDPRQEELFFTLLRECLVQGIVTEAFLASEIRKRHIRRDAFEVLNRPRGRRAPVTVATAARPRAGHGAYGRSA